MLRCKLALKPEDTDQLLFVNAHGRKVMLRDSENFLLCLSTGVAKALKLGSPFELALTRVINLRREQLEQQRRDIDDMLAGLAEVKSVCERALDELPAESE